MQWDRQKVLAYNLSAIPPYPLPFPVSPFCLFVYSRDATFPLTCIYPMTWLRPINNLQFLDRQVLYRVSARPPRGEGDSWMIFIFPRSTFYSRLGPFFKSRIGIFSTFLWYGSIYRIQYLSKSCFVIFSRTTPTRKILWSQKNGNLLYLSFGKGSLSTFP